MTYHKGDLTKNQYNVIKMSAKSREATAKTVLSPRLETLRRVTIVKEVKDAVDRKMAYLLQGLMVNIVDALFEEMYDQEEDQSLQNQFSISRALRLNGRLYQEEFTLLMNVSWANLIRGKDKRGVPEPQGEFGQLIKARGVRYFIQYRVLLEELRLRCSKIAGKELHIHPLLPVNFYVCFWHSTAKLRLYDEQRILLSRLFDRFVMDRFGQVLAVANQNLIEMEIGVWNTRLASNH